MITSIPSTMQSVVLKAYGGARDLELAERTTPKPEVGEVLVQVKASPINPSDLIFLDGHNPNSRSLPTIPGFEGSGIVVQSGGGVEAEALLGKNVSFLSKPDKDGAWAEYAVANTEYCIPLLSSVSWIAGAMLQINPLTAWTLVDKAQKEGHRYAIQTAAASTLGKMVVKFAAERNLGLINIVRKDEHVKLLKSLGASHVLNSESQDFDKDLQTLARENNATVAFDAISGNVSERLLKVMPFSSEVWVYGRLSGQHLEIDSVRLIYELKSVKGFWGPFTFYKLNRKDFNAAIQEIQGRLTTVFESDVHAVYQLSEFEKALSEYQQNMSRGKVLFVMNG